MGSKPHLPGSSSGQFRPDKRRKSNKYGYDRSLKGLGMCFTVPNRSSKQRVKGIQPVMHLLVITGLKEYPTMLCAYRKCVGALQFRQTLN